jgi:UDP-glucose-4-epimerase GalE
VPIDEDAPLSPINPYGATKLASERAIAGASASHNFPFAILRYFNACGADPGGEIGECHDPETHLIPLALDAVAGKGTLTLYGTDYPTPDGTCIRDYIHVTDLANAHVAALELLLGGTRSQTVTLGTGKGVSIREVVEAIERVTKCAVPLEFGSRREGDPAALVANPSLAERVLGWSAKHSDIDIIVATAWAWHQREHGGR